MLLLSVIFATVILKINPHSNIFKQICSTLPHTHKNALYSTSHQSIYLKKSRNVLNAFAYNSLGYGWKYEIGLTNSKCHPQDLNCHHSTYTNTPAIMLMRNKNSWFFVLIHFSAQNVKKRYIQSVSLVLFKKNSL